MSQLANALLKVVRKANNPNQLLFKMQLDRAKEKYLVRGELEGVAAAVQLTAPRTAEVDVVKGDENVEVRKKDVDGESIGGDGANGVGVRIGSSNKEEAKGAARCPRRQDGEKS